MADIVYFDEPGQHNTDAAFSLVKAAIQERGFKKVVLASTKGFTANLALEWFGDIGVTLIAVVIDIVVFVLYNSCDIICFYDGILVLRLDLEFPCIHVSIAV